MICFAPELKVYRRGDRLQSPQWGKTINKN